jgi:DNA repair protein RecN (Recombination protein N)
VPAHLHNVLVLATLRSLRIRNLALVDSLDWELADGFTAVTGETGAGKSIIVGALQLLVGERADKTLIRTGADQCSVEADFKIDDALRLNGYLAEQGIDPCEEDSLLMRRIFTAAGSGRQFVNGVQTTLAVLRALGDQLVDLHGPHDHQSLLSRDAQLQLVDAFARNENLFEKYRTAFVSLRADQKELGDLSASTADRTAELIRHQRQEIESAGLRPGELDELGARYKVAANARRIGELASAALGSLSEDENSILASLANVSRLLSELARLDERAISYADNLRTAGLELEELDRSLHQYQARLDLDPESLRQIEERLNLLESLTRKYHRNETELLELERELAEKLELVEHRDEAMETLQTRIKQREDEAACLAQELSSVRAKAAQKLAGEIQRHLAELGFRQSGFEITWTTLAELGPGGTDQIEFLFAPNPGEPLKPLRAIASSGEISRVMLALKTALAQEDLVGFLVFDEIDANVGGEIANAVGAKMRALGQSRQVLAITHLPQVAALAAKQYRVSKEIANGRTRTSLDEVTGVQRIEEIARMLGGRSESGLRHAKALLGKQG